MGDTAIVGVVAPVLHEKTVPPLAVRVVVVLGQIELFPVMLGGAIH